MFEIKFVQVYTFKLTTMCIDYYILVFLSWACVSVCVCAGVGDLDIKMELRKQKQDIQLFFYFNNTKKTKTGHTVIFLFQ